MLKEELFLTVTNCAEFEEAVERFASDKEWRAKWVARGQEMADQYFSDPALPEDKWPRLLEEIVLKEKE